MNAMESPPLLSSVELAEYVDRGIVVVEVPAAVQKLQQEFLSEIAVYLNFWHSTNVNAQGVASAILDLANRDRQSVGRLYQVSRRFPAARKIACSDWALRLAAQAMNTSLVSCCNFVSTRIDLPGETKFATAAHQDFPYIQGSLDGITIWLPLQDVSQEMGPPAFLPGSHSDGAGIVKELGRESADSGTATVTAMDEEKWNLENFETRAINVGEALVFSTLLVHRSNPNNSATPRLSLQLRFDNLCDEESFLRGYPEGLFLGKNLSDSYPELVQS